MSSLVIKSLACSIFLVVAGPSFATDMAWPDTPVQRLAALAVVQDLSIQLLSHDSATLTLERWCEDHRLADPAKISATRLKDTKEPPETVRKQLNVTAADKLGYRHVLLKCGTLVLSEADNWYVPARLTREMNQTLDTTDTPFGKVVAPLQFQRHTISSQLLWQPLPENWAVGGAIPASTGKIIDIPETLISNQALLSKPDGTPISFVVENYKSSLLQFAPLVFPQ
jgi:chorismate-pyruvate lyase